MEFKSEDVIAVVLLVLSFLALYLGKATWQEILPIITIIIGVYFGISVGYARAMRK